MLTTTPLAAAVRTAGAGLTSNVVDAAGYRDLLVFIPVTAAVSDLDIKIQDSPDQTTWYDLVVVPTISGTGNFRASASGSSGTLFGRYLRVYYTISGAGTPSFTFAVTFQLSTREAVA